MEFASLCLGLEKKVEIITNTNSVLEQHPREYTNHIVEKMKRQGANFVFNSNITEILKKGNDNYILKTKEGLEIKTNYILVAVGRKAIKIKLLNMQRIFLTKTSI